jgi:hypothetical protein
MRHRWLAGIFAFSAIWAILVAVVSTDHIHQLWGEIAAVGYGLALIAVLTVRHSRMVDLALGLAFLGGLVLPLGYLAARGLMQPEVAVVAQSAASLVHHGTPYMSWDKLEATTNQDAYNPYLPLMTLFGLPRAFFDLGILTDPRVWFGVVFIAVFWLALNRGGARHPGRWTVLVAGSPVIAFELAVGGTDVPMVAFLCLGFAYLWIRKPALAGLALGIGSSMKATAWPALAVGVAVLAVTMGRRAVRDFAVCAVAVLVVCIGPFIFNHPRALVENTIMFPLGLASVRSAASSPLPGHVIASIWPGAGHTIVVALLVVAGLAVAASLVFRPPRTVPRAVALLAGAMTLMFVLAPSTRFGYFIYPAALAIWVFAARAGRQAVDAELGQIDVGFLPARVPDGPPGT